MSGSEHGFGFAPERDQPIPYLQRIRDYYQALGYGAPYRWAHYAEVPFAPLERPLGECRIGLQPDDQRRDVRKSSPLLLGYLGALIGDRIDAFTLPQRHDLVHRRDARRNQVPELCRSLSERDERAEPLV